MVLVRAATERGTSRGESGIGGTSILPERNHPPILTMASYIHDLASGDLGQQAVQDAC
ncbi:hypothetical protein [Streptomyces rochei]|uniref:hypothetical protein n=1 Tax=Streptomyces rochei TaxID=1928 RepID=UPI003794A739